MNAFQRIAWQTGDGVGVITLNRPEKRNALDDLTVAELKHCLAEAVEDGAARVILLRGAGKDFCAGADLSQLEKIASGGSRDENYADAMNLGELLIRMRRFAKPIIAAVHGNALAGGAGLATACDVIVAHENATFGYPEVRLGFVPAMVLPLLVRRVGERTAFELTAFGHTIGTKQAQAIGLVDRVVSGDFEEETLRYARELATRSASAIRLIKRLLDETDGLAFDAAVRRGAEINVEARATEDCINGVREFLATRRKQ